MAKRRRMKNNENFAEEYRKKRGKMSPKRKMYLVILIILAVAALVVLSNTVFFKINNIEVVGSSYYQADAVTSYIDIHAGDNLLRINPTPSEKRIEEALPYVHNVDISRKLPSTLLVTITDEVPVYKIDTGYGSGLIMSADSKVLEKIENFELYGEVAVYGLDVSGYEVGKRLDEEANEGKLAMVKEIMRGILENDISGMSYIDIFDKYDITMGFAGRIKIFIGEPSDIENKMCMLASVLTNLSQHSTGSIDIRNSTTVYYNPAG